MRRHLLDAYREPSRVGLQRRVHRQKRKLTDRARARVLELEDAGQAALDFAETTSADVESDRLAAVFD